MCYVYIYIYIYILQEGPVVCHEHQRGLPREALREVLLHGIHFTYPPIHIYSI